MDHLNHNLNVTKRWKVPMPLTGNCFVFGRIGSGKTAKSLALVQAYHSRGYKYIDMFGGKRGEGPFICFKNDDHKLWKQLESETADFRVPGPKEYQVNLLYPMFSRKIPNKLPQLSPRIKSKIFTIPLEDIEEEDIPLVIGPIGTRAKTIWQNLKSQATKKGNGADLRHLADTKFKKAKNEAIYNLFIHPLVENHTISNKYCDLNLDIRAELQDRETVTVLCLDYVPERFHFFIMNYLMKIMIREVMQGKVHKKNIALFREASLFMKVVDADKSKEDTASIFRNRIIDAARYARSGLFLFMDTQDSSEVKGMVEGSDDIMGICEMPSPTSREVTCTPLKQDRRMNPAQIAYIATMPIHQICIVTRGNKAKILKRIAPPRSKYWKSSHGNFIQQWKKEYDSWRSTASDIDKIKEEYLDRQQLLHLRDKVRSGETLVSKEEIPKISVKEVELVSETKIDKKEVFASIENDEDWRVPEPPRL